MTQLSIEKAPATVKALPSLAQQMWLRVYNRTIRSQSSSKSVEVSWSVIKQFYRKNKKGKWLKAK